MHTRITCSKGRVSSNAVLSFAVHSNVYAVILAAISAVLIAAGTVWRHQIVRGGHRSDASPLASVKRPSWWGSVGLALLAYAFQVGALAFGSLLVVQPILVLSLMLTLVLSARVDDRRMTVPEAFWAVVLTACVGVMVVLGRPSAGTREVPAWEWAAVTAGGALVAAGAFAFAYRRSPATKALTLGLTCGAVFGLLAVYAKVAVDAFAAGGAGAMLATWQFWAVLGCAVVGMALQQYAFDAGELGLSLPASKVGEPLTALALGYALLGEKFAVGSSWGWALIGASISGMLLATAMLAREAAD